MLIAAKEHFTVCTCKTPYLQCVPCYEKPGILTTPGPDTKAFTEVPSARADLLTNQDCRRMNSIQHVELYGARPCEPKFWHVHKIW